MDKVIKNLIMFVLGCCFYLAIEIFFRGYSFRLMGLAGGVIFLLGGQLNDRFSWKMDLLLQCLIISILITFLELVVGNIDFYFLHLNMWDYSQLKYNAFNGKISLLFSCIWFLMGFVVVLLHDVINYYWLHSEEVPRYYIFGKKILELPQRKCE